MCILCGEFIMQEHWTDKDTLEDSKPKVVAGERQRERKRNHLHRVQLLNIILKHYGLQVNEWQGTKFIS